SLVTTRRRRCAASSMASIGQFIRGGEIRLLACEQPSTEEAMDLTVSIIIKALNEERNIAGAIESALAALAAIDGEVILADSGSSDRTIEIARRYPIRIVQLNNVADRSWGVGSQLGYQYSRGRYLCLIDGDMRLYGEFLGHALEFLERNPAV